MPKNAIAFFLVSSAIPVQYVYNYYRSLNYYKLKTHLPYVSSNNVKDIVLFCVFLTMPLIDYIVLFAGKARHLFVSYGKRDFSLLLANESGWLDKWGKTVFECVIYSVRERAYVDCDYNLSDFSRTQYGCPKERSTLRYTPKRPIGSKVDSDYLCVPTRLIATALDWQ